MKVDHTPDFPVTEAECKKATGKGLKKWFKELDEFDALTKGRRPSTQFIIAQDVDAWWATTIYVEYEAFHDVKKKDGLAEGYSICVTKSIAAPVAKVYEAWTDPTHFAQMFGESGTQAIQEGGKISCKGGCKGTFTRIRPEKDLRFTWEHKGCTAPMQVDVQFQDNKGKCLMNVMTSRIQSRPEADGLRNAWTLALGRLKAICES